MFLSSSNQGQLNFFSNEETIQNNMSVEDEYEKLARIDAETCLTEGSFRSARRKSNIKKNRFSNVLPNEHSRVVLHSNAYINANIIEFPLLFKKFSYIMTQHPLKNTMNDFWDMIIEHKVAAIVQLNVPKEENYTSSSFYSKFKSYYDFNSKGLPCISDPFLACSKITLRSKKTLGYYSLYHLHYTSWPDHGVPQSSSSVISMIETLNEILGGSCYPQTILVHCMAGVGRTGTFIAIHFALTLLGEKFDFHKGTFSFFDVVKFLKTKRTFSVQNKIQYTYCYNVVQQFLGNSFAKKEKQ